MTKMRPALVRYAAPPFCDDCKNIGKIFWSFDCRGCLELFTDGKLSHGALFSILRQWTDVHAKIDVITDKISFKTTSDKRQHHLQALSLGLTVRDRDALTDMTLLHYAVQAGCFDEKLSVEVVKKVLALGADPSAVVWWTNMRPIHYAAFYNLHETVKVLLDAAPNGRSVVWVEVSDIEERCSEFFSSTPLHIACGCFGTKTVKVLLQAGADPLVRDNLGMTPRNVVERLSARPISQNVSRHDITALASILRKAEELATSPKASRDPEVEILLAEKGISLGDRVIVRGGKFGTLRFAGKTSFATGAWAGIETDGTFGKHNGTVDGTWYFSCPEDKGLFIPLEKVQKLQKPSDYSFGLKRSASRVGDSAGEDITVGTRVLVGGRFQGIVRFAGLTNFASGFWYGVELDKPSGRNDGSVKGKQYFTCDDRHGIFAPATKLKRLRNQSAAEKPPTEKEAESDRSLMDDVIVNVTSINEKGKIRYVGPVTFAKGLWFGIELMNQQGEHDGKVFGRRYFKCADGHGLLVRPSAVKQVPRPKAFTLFSDMFSVTDEISKN